MGVAGLLFAGIGLWLRRRLPKSDRLTLSEYWVYLPEAKIPKLEALMDRMINANPHNKKGAAMIGAREGMMFTDIRLHVGLVKREKNLEFFRPDLFEGQLDYSPEALKALGQSQALAKIVYASEVPLADRRHLQFLPHYADALCELGDGLAVFDVTQEVLYSREEFYAFVDRFRSMERPDAHVRVRWSETVEEGTVESRGLLKVGFPELFLPHVPLDERQTAVAVMEEATGRLWKEPALFERMTVQVMGTDFHLTPLRRTRLKIDLKLERQVRAA